jgi:hypothetical protein
MIVRDLRTMTPLLPFTWSEAQGLGLSRREVDEKVRVGQLRRILRNVYVDSRVPDSLGLRACAAGLVLTSQGVFVDRTAAWLHGVDILDYRELEILPPLECVVLRDRSRIERPECVGGERDLAPQDVMRVVGVRVTTPLRTALDLGCVLRRPDALAAMDMFARLHGVTREHLEASLPRYRRRRGVVQLRGLVPLVDGLSESSGESRTRLAVHDAGLPPPVLQHWVHHHGEPLFRLDLAYPKHRVAVEYDGEDWHDRTQEQRDADRARRTWLEQHGWTTIVVCKGDFSPEGLTRWLGDLRDALRPGRR